MDIIELVERFDGLTSQGVLIIVIYFMYQHILTVEKRSKEREDKVREEAGIRLQIMLDTIAKKDQALFDALGDSKLIIDRLNVIDQEEFDTKEL